jgi:chromosome segregation ATPase
LTQISEIQGDIQTIKALLKERKEMTDKYSIDLNRAFELIRELKTSVEILTVKIEKLEESILLNKTAEKSSDDRIRSIEKGYHRMSWIITIATAVVCAAAVKFFVG